MTPTDTDNPKSWKGLTPYGLILLAIGVIGGVAMWFDDVALAPEEAQRWAAAQGAEPRLVLEPWLGAIRLRLGTGESAEPLGYATLLGDPRREQGVEATTGAPQPQRCSDAVPAWLPALPQGVALRCLVLPTTRGRPSFISFEIPAHRIEAEMKVFIEAMRRQMPPGPSGTTFYEEEVNWAASLTWTAEQDRRRVDLQAASNKWIKPPGASGVVVIRIIERAS